MTLQPRKLYKYRKNVYTRSDERMNTASLKVGVVIVARNERKYIKKTLRSLKRSTVPLHIVVVDDGSVDRTAEIAKGLASKVVAMPRHPDSYAGMPELAERFNVGLHYVPDDSDYVMILGADHPLPKWYVERILQRMIADNVIIASGNIKGEKFTTNVPRPSGVIYYYMWFKIIGFFPVNWGWESYPIVKAQTMGYKTKCYTKIKTKTLRKIRLYPEKMYRWGKGLKALGFTPDEALEIAYDLHSIEILQGYYTDDVKVYSDVYEFVQKMLKERKVGRLRTIADLLDRTQEIAKEGKRYRKTVRSK